MDDDTRWHEINNFIIFYVGGGNYQILYKGDLVGAAPFPSID